VTEHWRYGFRKQLVLDEYEAAGRFREELC